MDSFIDALLSYRLVASSKSPIFFFSLFDEGCLFFGAGFISDKLADIFNMGFSTGDTITADLQQSR